MRWRRLVTSSPPTHADSVLDKIAGEGPRKQALETSFSEFVDGVNDRKRKLGGGMSIARRSFQGAEGGGGRGRGETPRTRT